MSWALLSINRHLIILKVKVQFKDFIKHQNKKKKKKKKKKKSDHTALTLKKNGMDAFICSCSLLENLFMNPLVSAHIGLVFGRIVRGPLKRLKEKFLSNDDSSLNLISMYQILKTDCQKLMICSNQT